MKDQEKILNNERKRKVDVENGEIREPICNNNPKIIKIGSPSSTEIPKLDLIHPQTHVNNIKVQNQVEGNNRLNLLKENDFKIEEKSHNLSKVEAKIQLNEPKIEGKKPNKPQIENKNTVERKIEEKKNIKSNESKNESEVKKSGNEKIDLLKGEEEEEEEEFKGSK